MNKTHALIFVVSFMATAAIACRPAKDSASNNGKGDESSQSAKTPSTQDLDAALAKVSEMDVDDSADAPSDDASDESAGTTVTSNGGAYAVTFATDPSPIPLNEMFTIDVTVRDADGEPVTGDNVQLVVDAAMPAHGHGMNTKPKAERTGEGRYHIRGMLFHMPGEWELYFDVVRSGVAERAQADVVLE